MRRRGGAPTPPARRPRAARRRSSRSNGDNVIRSTGALYPWLGAARARGPRGRRRWRRRRAGELVEFEGSVAEDDPLSWLQARVVRSGCGLGGRFQVAATTDANFRETFRREDEGTEWRRLADGGGADRVAAEAAGAAGAEAADAADAEAGGSAGGRAGAEAASRRRSRRRGAAVAPAALRRRRRPPLGATGCGAAAT